MEFSYLFRGFTVKINRKILIVDDVPMNLEILEELLEDEFHLKSASSGEEALKVAPEYRPDLVLLDIMMPGIDGLDTCRRMRENSILKQTKIIMVSAKALVSERLEGYEVGADDYITKPFNKHEFMAKIKVYLRLVRVEENDRLKNELLDMLCNETGNP